MAFVVLAPGATALARSVVHSHQDSFGHELDLAPAPRADRRTAAPPATSGVALVCTCGWSGLLRADDVVLDHRVAV